MDVERMKGHSQGNKFAAGFGSLPVLYDIVKRRFVRTPPFGGLSMGTLNPHHMIGGLTAGHRTDLEKLVFSANTVRGLPRMGIGNENNQVS
jgi:hypothetical protein